MSRLEHGPEKDAALETARIESLGLERQASSETKPDRSVDKTDKEQRIEAARENLQKIERAKPQAPEKKIERSKPRRVLTRAESLAAYRTTMSQVRQQLPPLQRSFSKFVHARPVEVISELLEETLYRPSFLLSGGMGALLIGTCFYLLARWQGWRLSGSEFTLGLMIGGVIGWLVEFVWRRARRRLKD